MAKKLFIILLACIALFTINANAQQNLTPAWNSTSSMMQSGSAYSSQISPVGAENIDYSSTTSNSQSRVSNRRNAFDKPGEANQSDASPVGEPYIMLVFAVMAATIVALRRRKA